MAWLGHDKKQGSGDGQAYAHPDRATDAALDWFVTLQAAEGDADTIAAFERWLAADPSHATAFDRVAALSDMPAMRMASLALARRIRTQARRPVRRWLPLAAAAALVLVGIQLYPLLRLYWEADFRTATGSRQEFALPDGSKMMLNTASAVAIDFKDGRRSVRLLRGEAYFDVVRDAARPFKVAGGYGEIEVKGTAFAVRSDANEDTVVLERGRVDVARQSDRSNLVHLAPGGLATVTATSLARSETADIAAMLAWRDGRYVFHDQPLSRVVQNLRRYYSGVIFIANERVARAPVSGNYRTDDPESALRSLAGVIGAGLTRLPGGIVILR